MSKSNGARISAESKIIVGVEHSPKTGWHALHLHDALYAISVQPDRQLVVIGEGTGPGRVWQLRIPFGNILRFEAVEHSIGHSCLDDPVKAELLGDSTLIPEGEPFKYVAVRLLIKYGTRSDFISIHDVGTTPLPILVPVLKQMPEQVTANQTIALKSADDCYRLAGTTLEWVERVNEEIAQVRQGVYKSVGAEAPIFKPADAHRDRLQAMLNDVKSYDPLDLIQCKAGAGTAVVIATHLISEAKKSSLVGTVNLCSTFRLGERINREHPPYSTVDELYEPCRLYAEKTGRPIEEALDTIAEHLSDLKEREMRISASRDLAFIKTNAPKDFELIDVIRMVNENGRVLSRVELRHEEQLLKVFANEHIDVYELETLPFLSALFEYKTADAQRNFAVVTRKGIHQALKEFLMAHELGNFYSHFKKNIESESESDFKRFLRSSFRPTFLDEVADHFGMSFLFPPAYLADRVIFRGQVSTDELLDEYLAGMAPVTSKLRDAMRSHIDQHIAVHKQLEQAQEPSFLEFDVKSITPQEVNELVQLIEKVKPPIYWVRIDQNNLITNASDNAHVLFGLTKEELKGKRPTELVVKEEVPEMEKRAAYRKDNKSKIYYFTECKNLVDEKSTHQVIVYSFPILENDQYVGAMAAIRPLVEIAPLTATKKPTKVKAKSRVAQTKAKAAASSEIQYWKSFAKRDIGVDPREA